jgi:hypothetical protein
MVWLPETDLAATLWEGPLELLDTGSVRGDDEHPFDARALPVVAIGPPHAWPLADVYPPVDMPATLRTRVEQADFYLVRLHCSFRPSKEDIAIDWARFALELRGSPPPTAEAIHPEVVEEEVNTARKFTLMPSLTFAEVGVAGGEAAFGFEYKRLEPFVWGAREPVTTPSWDFQPTTGHRLYGSRQMYVLVRASPGATKGMARLHLVADLSVKRRLIGRAKLRRDLPPLEALLWGEG